MTGNAMKKSSWKAILVIRSISAVFPSFINTLMRGMIALMSDEIKAIITWYIRVAVA